MYYKEVIRYFKIDRLMYRKEKEPYFKEVIRYFEIIKLKQRKEKDIVS